MRVIVEYPAISKIYSYRNGYAALQLGGIAVTRPWGYGAMLLRGYAANPNTDAYPNTNPNPNHNPNPWGMRLHGYVRGNSFEVAGYST